jgi:hypothetical protein
LLESNIMANDGIAEAKQGFVYGGIQSRGTMTFDILGDTMLKSIYAVSACSSGYSLNLLLGLTSRQIFDLGNQRFGAVPRVGRGTNFGPAQS